MFAAMRCEELDLALRSDRYDAHRSLVCIGTLAAIPREGRGDRVGERREGETGCHRSAVVSQQHPAEFRVALRDPERELGPGLDACGKEILIWYPRKTCPALRNRCAVVKQAAHRQRGSRPHGVEDSDAVMLG